MKMSVFKLSIPVLSRSLSKEFIINLTKSKSNLLTTNQTKRFYSALQERQHAVVTMPYNARSVASQEITKNIQLFTDAPRNVDKDTKTLRLKQPIEKPLVIILSWLLAKHRHLSKYAELYIDQGFDVITVSTSPWQLMWPAKGTQLVAADLLKFLENNACNSPLLLHGFSVGGYFWGECMLHMKRDMKKYKLILDRICGQIWDSAADITEIPVGVPKALFPTNHTLQKALRGYMLYHLKTFHDAATTHYIRSSQMFHTTLVKSPALFLLSKNDPVGAADSNQRVRESWESMGVLCTWKCWEKSPHVSHYYVHREQYLEALFNHLQSVNMIRCPEKMRAKL